MPDPMNYVPTGGPPPPFVAATPTPAVAAPDLLLRYPLLLYQLLQRLHLLSVFHLKRTMYNASYRLVAASHPTAAASFILGSTTTYTNLNVAANFGQ